MTEATEAPDYDSDVHSWKFGKGKVRAVEFAGALHFVAADIFDACNLSYNASRLARLGPDHAYPCLIDENGQPAEVVIVSFVGAHTLAAEAPFPLVRIMPNWLRKRAQEYLTPPGGDPPMIAMTLLADGSVPPSPGIRSDRYSEWVNLRWANEAPRSTPAPMVVKGPPRTARRITYEYAR